MSKPIKVLMTPSMIAEYISLTTGKKVSEKTHWFRAICEQTSELPPYSLVTFEAIER